MVSVKSRLAVAAYDGSLSQPELLVQLSVAERQAYALQATRRRADWLSGRITLKQAFLISRAAKGSDPRCLEVRSAVSGQPYIAGHSSLHCSLAHSYGWSVAAVASQGVGVDIERIRPHSSSLLHYIAYPEEAALVTAVVQNPAAVLTTLWVVKEAVLKGLGFGLSLPLKRVYIARSAEPNTLEIKVNTARQRYPWRVWHTTERGFSIAIAYAATNYEQLNINWYNPAGVPASYTQEYIS